MSSHPSGAMSIYRVILCFCLSCCIAVGADNPSPFESVTTTGGSFRIVLPASGARWQIARNSEGSHLSSYGESIVIRSGDVITLVEKHIRHVVSSVSSPTGTILQCLTTTDMRSAGGKLTERKTILEAK
jgi:hypothetical protein